MNPVNQAIELNLLNNEGEGPNQFVITDDGLSVVTDDGLFLTTG